MQIITITKEMATAAYKNADTKEKQLLENLLGKENILPQKITDRIKTFDDALNAVDANTGKSIDTLLAINSTDPILVAAKISAMLMVICKALNEGWKPNWTNSSEYKWYPYFDMSSGSGLSFDTADGWNTHTTVGSRLCFKSRELAEYAGKQFIQLYHLLYLLD
jgi:hypothetical protein